MRPRLSVVVPFYNVGEYLPACLDFDHPPAAARVPPAQLEHRLRPEVRGYCEDAGFRVVSFGRRGFSYEGTDRRFLFKQLAELRQHRRVAANRLSTAIFYGVAAGCEPAVYGDRMEMHGENPLSGGHGRIERLWPEMLGKTVDLEAARATTDLELGKPWMVPPAELRMLFDWRERV